jgi:hypothetical protein
MHKSKATLKEFKKHIPPDPLAYHNNPKTKTRVSQSKALKQAKDGGSLHINTHYKHKFSINVKSPPSDTQK